MATHKRKAHKRTIIVREGSTNKKKIVGVKKTTVKRKK
jgi:hypothetical protein